MIQNNQYINLAHSLDPSDANKGKLISLSSGSGGVGKTLSAIYLSLFFQKLGKRALLLDCDLRGSNLNTVLGINDSYNINQMVNDRLPIKTLVNKAPCGVSILSSDAVLNNNTFDSNQKSIFISKLRILMMDYDIILLDTSSGLGEDSFFFNSIANLNIIVSSCDPHVLNNTYSFIKKQLNNLKPSNTYVLLNMSKSHREGYEYSQKLLNSCKHSSIIEVRSLGFIPYDPQVFQAINLSQVGSEENVRTIAAQAWCQTAHKILNTITD